MHESTPPLPERPTPRRRRALAGAAALSALIGAGGVVAASQFASAARPAVVADTPDDVPAHPVPIDDSAGWIAVGHCIDVTLGNPFDEVDDERWEAAEQACVDVLPLDIQEDLAAFDAFEQCIGEQLGDASILDQPLFDASDAAWDAAEVACADLLPAGFDEFEDCGEDVDDESAD